MRRCLRSRGPVPTWFRAPGPVPTCAEGRHVSRLPASSCEFLPLDPRNPRTISSAHEHQPKLRGSSFQHTAQPGCGARSAPRCSTRSTRTPRTPPSRCLPQHCPTGDCFGRPSLLSLCRPRLWRQAPGRLASALPVGEREGGRWKGAARAGHGEDEAAFLRLACAHGRGPMCCSDALAVAGLPYTRPRDVAARMGGRPGAGVKWWLLVASQSVL